VLLSHRNSVNVDCGFSAKVPDGFELVLDLLPELKERGLEMFKGTLRGEGKVAFSVRNLGREIVNLSHRQKVASIRIVPVYELNFKVVE
jgi:dUTPase